MAKYAQCPKCGNSERGTPIGICKVCAATFCTACDTKSGLIFIDHKCPKCGSQKIKRLGVINPK